jgi:hypothetical protein
MAPFEEISIFSNSSHLEWRAVLSDTILKGTHPGTIPARFGLIWFCGFRGEQPNFAEMILGWFSSKLFPAFQNTDQDGHHSQT